MIERKSPDMKNIRLLFPALLVILTGCRTPDDLSQKALFTEDSLKQIAERIRVDFSVKENQVITQIEKSDGPVSFEEWSTWERKNWLEWRMIDGEKWYYNRAASNLLLLKKFYEQKGERIIETESDPDMMFRLKHTQQVLNASDDQGNPVLPVKMEVTYTITVDADAVPEGEMLHCWLPWPKEYNPRQREVKLLHTSNPEYIIAPDSAIHSTVYMEELSKRGVPTVFQISFAYVSAGQHFNLSQIKVLPYDKASINYKKYTSEQVPHICFTDNVKRLADSICGVDNNPASIVSKIYFWFKENIPWAGALEYSIIPNIPEYVIKNRKGDCGMQTFLFISMLRYKGIPVKWQSGWMMPPDNKNLHDWCEVYLEGTGWVPVDVSYDLQNSDHIPIREFYLSGIDSYRLIVNDGIAEPLHPGKRYLRSEPYDFQRGEVEWKGGNLYFNKWNYNMKIRYLN